MQHVTVSLPQPNTFIGGVAGNVTYPFDTIPLLAVGLRIDSIYIENLVLDGFGNISCYVNPLATIKPIFNSSFWYNNVQITFFISSVKGRFEGSSPRNCVNLELIDAPKFTVLTGGSYIRSNLAKLSVRISDTVFNFNYNLYEFQCKRLYTPLVEYFGADASYNNIFSDNSAGGIQFYVSLAAETIDAGGIEGDLKYMQDNKSAVLNFIANTTPPSAISTLSAGTIATTTIQLNFTPPSSTNLLDFYEVWIDDNTGNLRHTKLRWQEITASAQNITGLASGTTYKIKIIACDEFWNRSEFSNEITVLTL